MKKTLSAILFFFAIYTIQGQTIILSDDLEGGFGAWALTGDLKPICRHNNSYVYWE